MLIVLSVGVVGVAAVDCDSVVKVVEVVVLSEMYTEYYVEYSERCISPSVLSSRGDVKPSFIWLNIMAV